MKFWLNNPGVRILLPFVMGIIAAVYLQINHISIIIISVVFITIFLFYFRFSSFKNRKLIGVLVFVTLNVMGYQYTISRTEKLWGSHFSHSLNSSSFYHVKVIDRLIEKENSYKTILKVTKAFGESERNCNGRILVYFKKSEEAKNLVYGDELIIENKIRRVESAKNPNQFDYSNYLNLNQINYQAFLDTSAWHKTKYNSGNILVQYSQAMRNKLYHYLEENGVVGDQLKVGSALLLGYRENLDKDLVKSYSHAGAMHVLAVSGLHVGILYLLLSNLLKVFNNIKNSKVIIAIILIITLWFYALMTGLSASVMRSSTMFTFIIIGDKLLNRKVSIYNTLAVSAIVLLIINPYMVFQVGFQLSYAAVLGIVYLQPKLFKLLYFNSSLLQKIWAITCVSIAAQIATFPMSLYYFHQFPVYFLVSNLVVIPSAILIFYLGIGLFVVSPFGGVSVVIGKLLNFFLWILNQAIFVTEKLPFSLIEEIALSVVETYLLYLIIIMFLVALYYRKLQIVFVSLFCSFVFLGFQLKDQYSATHQSYLTFYSIKDQTVFEIVENKKIYFVSSKGLKNDWNTMLFNVNNNWNHHNLVTKTYLDVDSLSYRFEDDVLVMDNGVFNYRGTILQVLADSYTLKLDPDYLIVNKKSLKLLKSYLKQAYPKFVIFDSSVPNYNLKYYTKYISPNVEIISLSQQYFSVQIE